ncbi:serine/arginine repetitive matrix protein 2 [Pyrus ussuriensis x Pyrus communis]|uniref:Serine/arginine repetitive matrix protein 2 n=2 Tax=Pyrus TaxID=3766 RepID=A0A5N5FZF3_9ROSA|nr:serine/arginine repetitive matrix protein 2 [Pyrus ussuriensis x Pyrus communis]KAB2608257.1 serine/arginine repetitive matrix protein 2 [Pyrus ussuriensis x Pyrus communis]
MEPSFHKYVTVRRGTGALEDMEDQESSGSNSFVSGSSCSQQHNWGFTSSWQPNSADSTDCWASRSNTKEEDHKTPLSLDKDEAAKRRLTGRHHQRSGGGIGRGRLATINAKGLPRLPGVAAAASM